MKIPKNFEENKLICEFMECQVYEAYRSPTYVTYTVKGQMVIDLRKEGMQPFGYEKSMMIENLKFDQSWDWFFFVWNKLRNKIYSDEKTLMEVEQETFWHRSLIEYIIKGNLSGAYLDLVEGIKHFNEKGNTDV